MSLEKCQHLNKLLFNSLLSHSFSSRTCIHVWKELDYKLGFEYDANGWCYVSTNLIECNSSAVWMLSFISLLLFVIKMSPAQQNSTTFNIHTIIEIEIPAKHTNNWNSSFSHSLSSLHYRREKEKKNKLVATKIGVVATLLCCWCLSISPFFFLFVWWRSEEPILWKKKKKQKNEMIQFGWVLNRMSRVLIATHLYHSFIKCSVITSISAYSSGEIEFFRLFAYFQCNKKGYLKSHQEPKGTFSAID